MPEHYVRVERSLPLSFVRAEFTGELRILITLVALVKRQGAFLLVDAATLLASVFGRILQLQWEILQMLLQRQACRMQEAV